MFWVTKKTHNLFRYIKNILEREKERKKKKFNSKLILINLLLSKEMIKKLKFPKWYDFNRLVTNYPVWNESTRNYVYLIIIERFHCHIYHHLWVILFGKWVWVTLNLVGQLNELCLWFLERHSLYVCIALVIDNKFVCS